MPGRLFQTRPLSEVATWLGLDVPDFEDPPRANIAPGQEIVVIDHEGEFRRMRWGIVPVGRVNARGRPVMETLVNARSETVFEKSAYEGVGRAVVPVEGWYEWTGAARRKTAWAFRGEDVPFLLFAAITDRWEAPGGRVVDQAATVTCEPNADVAPIHHRMGVLLDRNDLSDWLGGDVEKAKALMRPWPDGELTCEKVENVDWSAP